MGAHGVHPWPVLPTHPTPTVEASKLVGTSVALTSGFRAWSCLNVRHAAVTRQTPLSLGLSQTFARLLSKLFFHTFALLHPNFAKFRETFDALSAGRRARRPGAARARRASIFPPIYAICLSAPLVHSSIKGMNLYLVTPQACSLSYNGQYGTPKRDPLTLPPHLSGNFFALRTA